MKTCIEEISSKRAVMKESKKKRDELESKNDLSLVDFMSSCTLKI